VKQESRKEGRKEGQRERRENKKEAVATRKSTGTADALINV